MLPTGHLVLLEVIAGPNSLSPNMCGRRGPLHDGDGGQKKRLDTRHRYLKNGLWGDCMRVFWLDMTTPPWYRELGILIALLLLVVQKNRQELCHFEPVHKMINIRIVGNLVIFLNTILRIKSAQAVSVFLYNLKYCASFTK